MRSDFLRLASLLGLAAMLSHSAMAAPVELPTFIPDSTRSPAPLQVTLRCAAKDASIYVTLDGSEPTTRDTELDPGATILLDEPCKLKARVVLADGSVGAVKTGVYALTPVKGLGASFVEQEVPAVMAAGRVTDVSITLRNLGTTAWEPGGIGLVPRREKDGVVWGLQRVPLTEAAGTWKLSTFNFRVTAPSEPGTYNFQWQLRDADEKAFGETTSVMRVQVVPLEQLSENGVVTKPSSDGESRTTESAAAGTSDARSRSETTAAEVRWAKVQRFAAEHGVKPGSDVYPLLRALRSSPHSFKALRERGFKQTDEEFEKIIADHPELFRSMRIIRRDEQGKRIIPGWPAIGLGL